MSVAASAPGCQGICDGYCNFDSTKSRSPETEHTQEGESVTVALICKCCGSRWGYTGTGEQAFSLSPSGNTCPQTAEKIKGIFPGNQSGCEGASGGSGDSSSSGCSGSSTTTT